MNKLLKDQCWRRCVECGKFVSYKDFETGKAKREMITPDSHYTVEQFETICKNCKKFSRK